MTWAEFHRKESQVQQKPRRNIHPIKPQVYPPFFHDPAVQTAYVQPSQSQPQLHCHQYLHQHDLIPAGSSPYVTPSDEVLYHIRTPSHYQWDESGRQLVQTKSSEMSVVSVPVSFLQAAASTSSHQYAHPRSRYGSGSHCPSHSVNRSTSEVVDPNSFSAFLTMRNVSIAGDDPESRRVMMAHIDEYIRLAESNPGVTKRHIRNAQRQLKMLVRRAEQDATSTPMMRSAAYVDMVQSYANTYVQHPQ